MQHFIISDESINVDQVMDWLNYYSNENYYRWSKENEKVLFNSLHLDNSLNECNFFIEGGQSFNISQIQSFFIRQGFPFIANFNYKSNIDNLKINANIESQQMDLMEYIEYSIDSKRKIGRLKDQNLNKLIVLSKAKEVGLLIPDTIVTCNKSVLEFFLLKHKSIITKSISNIPIFQYEEEQYLGFTNEITMDEIEWVPNFFPPSLFQKKINKKYEIRTFFIDGEFYSSAIFSQNNQQTAIDFRRYDTENPSRVVVFDLPKVICEKLINLFHNLNLNTGSVDIIYDTDNNFIFLEINPVGQYEQVSVPCNNYLHKKIALKMLGKDE